MSSAPVPVLVFVVASSEVVDVLVAVVPSLGEVVDEVPIGSGVSHAMAHTEVATKKPKISIEMVFCIILSR
jgi:hypothetical protein